MRIDLQLFGEGETESGADNSQASIDYGKILFDDKGKLNADAYKVLQPYLDSEKHKHLDTWQKNNLSKYVEKDKFEQLQSEMTASLTKAEINTALVRELGGTKYPDLLMKEINFESIKKTDNGLIGVSEEIGRLKEKYPDFWGSTEEKKPTTKGGGGVPEKANQTIDEADEIMKNLRSAAGLK